MLDVGNISELFPLPCFQIPFAKHNIEDVNSEQERITETPPSVLIGFSLQSLSSKYYHFKSTKIS